MNPNRAAWLVVTHGVACPWSRPQIPLRADPVVPPVAALGSRFYAHSAPPTLALPLAGEACSARGASLACDLRPQRIDQSP